jgi:hypothetical protein
LWWDFSYYLWALLRELLCVGSNLGTIRSELVYESKRKGLIDF